MLQDFLALEQFYGYSSSVLFIDDIVKKYGKEPVKDALQNGFLMSRFICLGPDCGRCICWLSEKGRKSAS